MNPQNQDVTTTTAEHSSDQLTTAAASRRKFLVRASAASLPVIASIQSGSAWGCVDLKCTPGQTALSTSGSAVASAQASKAHDYLANKPKWSTFTVIDAVVKQDFDSYLLTTDFLKPYYTKKQTNTLFQGSKSITPVNLSAWLLSAQNSTVYTRTNSTWKVKTRTNRTSTDIFNAYGCNTKLVWPAFFKPSAIENPILIIGSTPLSAIFGVGVTGTIATFSTSNFKYIAAAFIGALWEEHPEYKMAYKGRQPCYPSSKAIVDKFKSMTPAQREGMENLFEFYTTGKVNNVAVK